MNDRFRVLVFSAALLAGLSGVARADLTEPSPPAGPQIKLFRPVPIPRPAHRSPMVARKLPVITQAPTPELKPKPGCSGLFCGRMVLVGIGF